MKHKIPILSHRQKAQAALLRHHTRLSRSYLHSPLPEPATSAHENVLPSAGNLYGRHSLVLNASRPRHESQEIPFPTSPERTASEWTSARSGIAGQGGRTASGVHLGESCRDARALARDIPHVARNRTYGFERKLSNRERVVQYHEDCPCTKQTTLCILFFAFSVLLPVSIVQFTHIGQALSEVPSAGSMSATSVARFLKTKENFDSLSENHTQALWVSHVVRGSTGHLLVPETFESRLNAEVAPILEQHLSQVWEEEDHKNFTCHSPERTLVAFSMAESPKLAATLSFGCPCTLHPESGQCVQQKHVKDIRDLKVKLPAKYSRHTFAVKIYELPGLPGTARNVSKDKRVIFEDVRGPLSVRLLDDSLLRIRRYCATTRKSFAEDVEAEMMEQGSGQLLAISKLKQFVSLWSPRKHFLSQTQNGVWDTLQLSKATINPIDHSAQSTGGDETVSKVPYSLSKSFQRSNLQEKVTKSPVRSVERKNLTSVDTQQISDESLSAWRHEETNGRNNSLQRQPEDVDKETHKKSSLEDDALIYNTREHKNDTDTVDIVATELQPRRMSYVETRKDARDEGYANSDASREKVDNISSLDATEISATNADRSHTTGASSPTRTSQVLPKFSESMRYKSARSLGSDAEAHQNGANRIRTSHSMPEGPRHYHTRTGTPATNDRSFPQPTARYARSSEKLVPTRSRGHSGLPFVSPGDLQQAANPESQTDYDNVASLRNPDMVARASIYSSRAEVKRQQQPHLSMSGQDLSEQSAGVDVRPNNMIQFPSHTRPHVREARSNLASLRRAPPSLTEADRKPAESVDMKTGNMHARRYRHAEITNSETRAEEQYPRELQHSPLEFNRRPTDLVRREGLLVQHNEHERERRGLDPKGLYPGEKL